MEPLSMVGLVTVGLVATATGGAIALPLLGFTGSGVAAGSVAAGIQSGIGSVAAGSIFAAAQSAGTWIPFVR